ncbi:hypothetical protein N7G274_007446 [Stereocaulon virgatum]|uniref:DUF726-domain-containing protein n=1 Tax=Stereocaulon virgatum TaxID=373712 RepID=A0ABR4A9J8_9LECA
MVKEAKGADKSGDGSISSQQARPPTVRAKSSTIGPRKVPPKLPLKDDNVGDSLLPQSRKPSLPSRRLSSMARKSSAAEPKRRPPKLPPKRGSEKRPPLQERKSSAVLKKDIQARMKRIESISGQGAPKANEKEQDLKSCLSDSQCEDLIRLTSSIMVRMRKTIEDNFDPAATLTKIGREGSGEITLENIDFDPGTVDVGEYDKERKLRDERQKELSKPKIKELRTANLKWFHDWRVGFLQRVTETVMPEKSTLPHQPQVVGVREATSDVRSSKVGLDEDKPPPRLEQLFPRIRTSLTKLPIKKRELILHSFLLLLLSLENYNAASRVFLLYLTSSLKLGLKSLREDEEKTAKGLLQAAKQLAASKETIKKAKESEESRVWKMRLATVAGAAIVGISGGYAAPLIAASVGTVMSEMGLGASAAAGYLGSVAGNTYLVGSMFGAYGGRMTGEMMRNLSADVQDFAFLPVHGERKQHKDSIEAATDSRRLRVTIAISGWLLEKEEVVTPWRVLSNSAEVFALRFELETLMKLGQSINTMTSNNAYGYAQTAFTTRAAYTELSSAIWPLALVKIARVVENPFSLAKTRAEKAGKVLAEALINRTQGERPVTLVGYSLGARVIWSCLTNLAQRKAFGLVESAVLIGSPIPSDIGTWRLMRTAVSGRLVNVYSINDYLLAFLHRASSLQYGVAGLAPVPGLTGVENFDMSDTVSGHLRYRYLVGAIMQKIGFEGIDKVEIAKEAAAFKAMVEEEKKYNYVQDAKESAGELYKQYGTRSKQRADRKISDMEADKQASAMEKEVQQKTQKGLMQWAVEQLYISQPSAPSARDVERKQSNSQAVAKNTVENPAKTTDAANKSVYQRAKDAVYLTRSGGSQGQEAAKGRVAETQNAASSAAPNSYLATAAGYIPTGYIPNFRTGGITGKTANTKDKQATKPVSPATEKKKPSAEDRKPSTRKPEMPKLPRCASTQKKSEDGVKVPAKGSTGAKEGKRHELTNDSPAPADDMQQRAPDAAKTARDASSNASKYGREALGKSAEKAPEPGGMSSYIPSFGWRSASKSSKDSIAEVTPTTSDDPDPLECGHIKPADGSMKPIQQSAEDTPRNEEGSTTPKEKASTYSSYVPSFGFGGFSSRKAEDLEAGEGDEEGKAQGAREDGKDAKEGNDMRDGNNAKNGKYMEIGKSREDANDRGSSSDRQKTGLEDPFVD